MVDPISPSEKKMYEQEYRHSADLFQKALAQYGKAENTYQQAQFQQVMNQSMQILNETANELMRKELQQQNIQIEKDYAAFQKHPKDAGAVKALNHDLDQARKSV